MASRSCHLSMLGGELELGFDVVVLLSAAVGSTHMAMAGELACAEALCRGAVLCCAVFLGGWA